MEQKDTARKTLIKEFIEKIQAIIDETLQRPIREIARDLGVSHTTVNACMKEDLKCRSYRRQTSQILTEKTKNPRLIKSISPLLPRPEPVGLLWSYVENITNMTFHNTNTAWSPPSAEHSPTDRRCLWKRHASSSESVSGRWLRLKVATLKRCQLYYIIKLPELIFSIKVFLNKAVVLFSLGRQFYRFTLYIPVIFRRRIS